MDIMAIKFLILTACCALGYFGGWTLTEKWPLSSLGGPFRFTAFECRPCLSTHIAWWTSVLVSLAMGDIVMAVIGVVMALMMLYGLRIDELERTEKVEHK